MTLDPTGVHGIRWHDNGQCALSGMPLERIQGLDRMFAGWARSCGAEEHRFPVFIAARELQKLDYFRSFPHLVTFPVALESGTAALQRFVQGRPVDDAGVVSLGPCAPVRDVLTPAACYHFYVALQGQEIAAPRTLTTVATCFRREERYDPLQRQWAFTMREIVRLGGAEDVIRFLGSFQERLAGFFAGIGLSVDWRHATDSFFDPSRNPRYLAQMIEPVKTEMIFGDGLAIGSINFHRNFFGETFGIRCDGEPVFSGCVAFGLERWLYALLSRFGGDDAAWPRELLSGAPSGESDAAGP